MITLKIHLHGERITQDLLFHTHTHGMFIHVKNVISQKNICYSRPLVKCIPINYFSYFSTKTYVEGTQKNHLNETVPLSTENIC